MSITYPWGKLFIVAAGAKIWGGLFAASVTLSPAIVYPIVVPVLITLLVYSSTRTTWDRPLLLLVLLEFRVASWPSAIDGRSESHFCCISAVYSVRRRWDLEFVHSLHPHGNQMNLYCGEALRQGRMETKGGAFSRKSTQQTFTNRVLAGMQETLKEWSRRISQASATDGREREQRWNIRSASGGQPLLFSRVPREARHSNQSSPPA